MKERARVGVFDSGIGGLTVLGECLRVLSDTDFYYYGDNGNAPYGNKSEEEIFSLTRRAVGRLSRLGADAVVLACNTATAICLERLRREFGFPIVGVEPAVQLAAASCKNVLVLATPRTAESRRLAELVAGEPNCRFTVCGLPHAAGEIERRLTQSACDGGAGLGISALLRDGGIPEENFDGVVLGCTHYSYFEREFSEHFRARTFDGGREAAKRLLCALRDDMTIFVPNGAKEGIITPQIPTFLGQICKCSKFGDHRRPRQSNVCFLKNRNNRLFFLEKWGKINENVFVSNVCFK